MATILQRGDKWRVQIRMRGIIKSATFNCHADAKVWATREELKIMDNVQGNSARNTLFSDICLRYLNEVTPLKRGFKEESYRINRILKTNIGNILLSEIQAKDFANWRDERLKEVSPASVNREITTLSSICEKAVKEWGVLSENPLRKISKPKQPKPRSRRPSNKEVNDICEALLWSNNNESKPTLTVQRVAIAFLFAIETAMRAGEICNLKWEDINESKRIAHLPITKNGDSRDVPLSLRALNLIDCLRGIDEDYVFNIDSASLDTLFRRARDKCEIIDLHFHDTRREALTRMSKKVPVEVLAKISGHRDLRILLNTYYKPDMSDFASLLD